MQRMLQLFEGASPIVDIGGHHLRPYSTSTNNDLFCFKLLVKQDSLVSTLPIHDVLPLPSASSPLACVVLQHLAQVFITSTRQYDLKVFR